MHITQSPVLGLPIIHATVMEDHRGHFWETYHQAQWAEQGITNCFVQENQSYSKQGTIRGLHYQLTPYAQAKLVRAITGTIWDVAVDLRKGSPTFGKWEGIWLSDTNKKQWLIPPGYAHGFSVLSDEATVLYKCDAFYHPAAETGIHYLDRHLNIDWQLGHLPPIVSNKDVSWPNWADASMNFIFES